MTFELSNTINTKSLFHSRMSRMGQIDIEERKESLVHADAALEYLDHEDTAPMTTIDEKNLVRKIDWMIIPLMWCCYNLQYLDKTLINYAAVG